MGSWEQEAGSYESHKTNFSFLNNIFLVQAFIGKSDNRRQEAEGRR
jgi:hypothetical protein